MISYVNSDLYKQDGTYKQINIQYSGGTITNSDLHAESFSLEESLCSEQILRFGSCETAKLQFRVRNPFDSLKGENITVKNILNGNTSSPFQIGKYKVFSDVPSADRSYRDITAYDAMYDILNTDVTEWYEGLFPTEEATVTLKNLRSAFASHFGLSEVSTSLVNDSMIVEKTISGENITGKMVLSAICEINGCFGNISRDGKLRYVSLVNPTSAPYVISTGMYRGSPSYEDYSVKPISKLQLRQEEGDVGVIVGSGENTYVVEGNFLVYGKEESDLTTIANNLFNAIKNVSYTPFSVTAIGNPCLEVGDLVRVNAKTATINSYVLRRTLKGIQSLSDLYESKGTELYEKNNNNIYSDVQQLKGKSNILKRDLESTKSTITDLEENTSTKFEQTSSSFNASIQSLETSMKASDETTAQEFENIKKQLDVTATSEQIKIEIQKSKESGADKLVTSTGYTLDENGLHIEKSGSEMATSITEDGMTVSRSGEEVLKANSEGVDAINLHAKTYLIIGGTSRFEDYYDESGRFRTGCFWIGEEEVPVTLNSISASYTGGDVPVGTAVNTLSGITVTAYYSDGTSAVVTGYTLSGNIAEGSNTITVLYEGKRTRFFVVGYAEVSTSEIVMKTGIVTNTNTINTGLKSIQQFVLYRETIGSTGLIDLTYNSDLGTRYTYCSSYSVIGQATGGITSSSTYVLINGGAFTWNTTSSNYAMASGVTYKWVAIGES